MLLFLYVILQTHQEQIVTFSDAVDVSQGALEPVQGELLVW